MKKDYKHGEIYASDLLGWVGIPKKDNDNLLMELIDLFGAYAEEDIKIVYQDIMFLCELPNGQMRGKLPPLKEIKRILDGVRRNTKNVQTPFTDYAMVCPKCSAAYGMDQYRCYDGYVITDIGNGYTEAVPCRDSKDSRIGPRLVKEELVPVSMKDFKFLELSKSAKQIN